MKQFLHKYKDLIDCCILLLGFGSLAAFLCISQMEHEAIMKYSTAFGASIAVPNQIKEFFIQQSINNILLCLVVYYLGFSVLGIPFIQLIVFIKGFQIGFYVALFLISYQMKGIVGIVLTLVPQILFDTLAIVHSAVVSIHLSGKMLVCVSDTSSKLRWSTLINRYLSYLSISTALVIISSLVKSTIGIVLIQCFNRL